MGKLFCLLFILILIIIALIDPLFGVVWVASLVGVIICIVKIIKKK